MFCEENGILPFSRRQVKGLPFRKKMDMSFQEEIRLFSEGEPPSVETFIPSLLIRFHREGLLL
jgi:hypothetical protein